MDASQRLSELVEVLRRDGRVDVATAAAEFGTAELTIRRDLDVLVERGVARRVRGGAVNLLMRGEELPFAMRAIEVADSKRRIAAAVAELIADGEAVGLDSGTTVAETARALAGQAADGDAAVAARGDGAGRVGVGPADAARGRGPSRGAGHGGPAGPGRASRPCASTPWCWAAAGCRPKAT